MRLPAFELERWFARHEFTAPVHARACDVGAPSMAEVPALGSDETRSEWEALLLPGSVYGHAGEHFRLGFGRRTLPEALARLECVL